MLCQFGQTRNGSVATHFILLSSTATISVTGGYVVVPECFGQNEEPASNKEERTGKNLVLLPKVDLTDAVVFLTSNHDFPLILF